MAVHASVLGEASDEGREGRGWRLADLRRAEREELRAESREQKNGAMMRGAKGEEGVSRTYGEQR
jgi:hypothetical protein